MEVLRKCRNARNVCSNQEERPEVSTTRVQGTASEEDQRAGEKSRSKNRSGGDIVITLNCVLY